MHYGHVLQFCSKFTLKSHRATFCTEETGWKIIAFEYTYLRVLLTCSPKQHNEMGNFPSLMSGVPPILFLFISPQKKGCNSRVTSHRDGSLKLGQILAIAAGIETDVKTCPTFGEVLVALMDRDEEESQSALTTGPQRPLTRTR